MEKQNSYAYNFGRLIAIVECALDYTRVTFPADCIEQPRVAFVPKLKEATIREGEQTPLIIEIVNKFDSEWAFPEKLTNEEMGQAWIGYYHQKARDKRIQFGNEMAKRRIAKGLTQKELAEQCGVNHTNISKIEQGKYNVSLDLLNKVADALDGVVAINDK